jgi:hypothetical protein
VLAVGLTPNVWAAYEVHACNAAVGGVNRTWISHQTAPTTELTTFSVCPAPTNPDPYNPLELGIGVFDTFGGGAPRSDGRFAEQQFQAPTGTRIVSAAIRRDIGNRNEYWVPYGGFDGVDVPSETCFAGIGQAYCRVSGLRTFTNLNAQSIAYGARCQTVWGSCTNGATLHEVWVLVLSATVTLDDLEPPTVGPVSGGLADGRWHNGGGELRFSATDNTGIRIRRLVEGETVRASRTAPGAAQGGCGDLNVGDAYTYAQPCAGSRGLNGEQAVAVPSVCGWGDGLHELRGVAVDTGGRQAVSPTAVTVRVDCTPPRVDVGPDADRVVAPGTAIAPDVTATDAHAGVAATEIQVQDTTYAWRPYTGPLAL